MRAYLTILAAFTLIALAGCGAEFDPFHLANKYRVLTIKAEPPELVIDPALFTGQGGQPPPPIELTALTSPPPAGTTYTWEACLFSLDTLGAFACASEDLEVTLDADGPTATLDLLQLFLAVADGFEDPGAEGEGEGEAATDCDSPVALPDGTCVESFRIQLRLTTGPAGEEIVAVRSVGVSLDPTRTANTNPDITALEVDGTPTRGGEVTLRAVIDPASLEQYTDLDGDTVTERPVMSWFTTAGELTPGATFDDDRDTTLTLPADPAIDSVDVYLVVRDSDTRRGIDFASVTLTLE